MLTLLLPFIQMVTNPTKVKAASTLSYELLGTHPDAANQPTAYGKTLHQLEYLNGKIYAAFGDGGANTGPVTINPFDISLEQFTGNQLTIPSEETDTIRTIGGKLYMPTIDPTCGYNCPAGFATGEPWTLEEPFGDVIHAFDMETLNGTDLWEVGGAIVDGVEKAVVWRSVNGQDNWTVVQSETGSSPEASGRYHWIKTLNGKIYVQAKDVDYEAPVRVFDGSTWSTVPGVDINGATPNMETFDGKIITRDNGLSTFDGTTLTKVAGFGGQVKDMYVDDGYLYILRTTGTLTRTDDLETFQELGQTVSGASSLLVRDGRVYVGTEGAKIFGSNEAIPDYVPPSASGDFPPSYISQFGSTGNTNANAQDIAYDSSGNSYTIDPTGRRIIKRDSSGAYLKTWGSNGSADGQFSSPQGITIDNANNIFVADSGNNRIQKFNTNGDFISKWGSAGSGNGQFQYPIDVTFDANNVLYVVDMENARVQTFNTSGVYIDQFGSEGSGDGQFSFPSGVAVDDDLNIYVVDGENGRIQKFNSAFNYVTQWGQFGVEDENFYYPSKVTVGQDDNIYVADVDEPSIKKFTSNGTFISKWASGSGDTALNALNNIETAPDGKIMIIHSRFVKAFDTSGNFVSNVDVGNGLSPGKLNSPNGIAVDAEGNTYIADKSNYRVQKFDANGNFVRIFGSRGTDDGQFSSPTAVAVDLAGNVFVLDDIDNRVQKFDANGNFLSKFGTPGNFANGEFSGPSDIQMDASGNIYVADSSNNRIQKFDANGNFLSKFGTSGSGQGEFTIPTGIAFDSLGNIYIADGGNRRVQKFDQSGSYIAGWGIQGSLDGQFGYAYKIAIDAQDNVYVTDSTTNHRVQKFDTSGNFLAKWGSSGTIDGQFSGPRGIAINSQGVIHIVDSGNNRIQKFAYIHSADLSGPDGKAVLLETPDGTTINCATTLAKNDLDAQDSTKEYPLGLVDFCLRVKLGSSQQITLTFETDLKPDQVTARKYNASTLTYADIPGATVAETTLNGQHALKLTYEVTDGGDLDADGQANGQILDPAGLALNESSTNGGSLTDSLARTGQNINLFGLLSLLFITAGLGVLLKTRSQN